MGTVAQYIVKWEEEVLEIIAVTVITIVQELTTLIEPSSYYRAMLMRNLFQEQYPKLIVEEDPIIEVDTVTVQTTIEEVEKEGILEVATTEEEKVEILLVKVIRVI